MRPPEVFVRELSPAEGQGLKRLSKRAKHASSRQRAAILLASHTLMSPPQIARLWMTNESQMREVIHDFNERGFDSLTPNWRGGRPRRLSDDERARIVANLSCHWTKEIRAWAAGNNVELVPTPTYASYLNTVECHLLPISEFVCKNADYLDWDAFGYALAEHIRYRNDPLDATSACSRSSAVVRSRSQPDR